MLPVPAEAVRFGRVGAVRAAVQHVDAAAVVGLEAVDFRHRTIVGRGVLQASGCRLRDLQCGVNSKLTDRPESEAREPDLRFRLVARRALRLSLRDGRDDAGSAGRCRPESRTGCRRRARRLRVPAPRRFHVGIVLRGISNGSGVRRHDAADIRTRQLRRGATAAGPTCRLVVLGASSRSSERGSRRICGCRHGGCGMPGCGITGRGAGTSTCRRRRRIRGAVLVGRIMMRSKTETPGRAGRRAAPACSRSRCAAGRRAPGAPGRALSSSVSGGPATRSPLTMVVPPCRAHSLRIARRRRVLRVQRDQAVMEPEFDGLGARRGGAAQQHGSENGQSIQAHEVAPGALPVYD